MGDTIIEIMNHLTWDLWVGSSCLWLAFLKVKQTQQNKQWNVWIYNTLAKQNSFLEDSKHLSILWGLKSTRSEPACSLAFILGIHSFSCCCEHIADEEQLGRVCLGSSAEPSVRAGQTQSQEREAAGHIGSAVRKRGAPSAISALFLTCSQSRTPAQA